MTAATHLGGLSVETRPRLPPANWLLRLDVRIVLRRNHNKRDRRLNFVVTARHRPDEIERAVGALDIAALAIPQLPSFHG
jgi:hypothetical protein